MKSPKHQTLQQQAASLPHLPGVYRFSDEQGQLLYVGKAKDLKRRVLSYFQRDHQGSRTGLMIARIWRMDTTVVSSEAEALLLENNLIKTQNPQYNILFRDDKTYPYIKFSHSRTWKSDTKQPRLHASLFPRISYYRGSTEQRHTYFGPFPNVLAVRQTLEILQKVFQLRTCEDAVFNNRSRPCLLHQIKRCSAPCVGLIDHPSYLSDVQEAMALLRGENNRLQKKLHDRMTQHAQAMQYEHAALVRDRIASLASILQQQSVDNTSGERDADIICVHSSEGKACVNLAMVRAGRHLGDRAYFPSQVNVAIDAIVTSESAQNNEESTAPTLTHEMSHIDARERQILHAFIAQHYLSLAPPALIITEHKIDPDLLAVLVQHHGSAVRCIYQPRGQQREWLKMAQNNANLQIMRLLSEEGSQRKRTQALAQALHLQLQASELDDLRIECFDISHTSGEATQASCVVFTQHKMQSSEYRRFNIQDIIAGDDYAAMRQVLHRRYRKIAELHHIDKSTASNAHNEQTDKETHEIMRMPDIVLIDGGKGQISAAREVFEQLGLDISLLIGVEKGLGRKVGLEELVFADDRSKISLPSDSAALMLIAQIRDEAHRFAITGMRARRAKTRTGVGSSRLEEIEGIGPKRRARLLQHFGGMRGVSDASVADLSKIEGISLSLAQQIYRALH